MFIRAILSIIFLLMSPIIIISNVLILSTWFRFKRLRTPSNFLIISLSTADLGFGLVMPAAVAVDLTLQQHHATTNLNNVESSSSNDDPISSSGDGKTALISNMTNGLASTAASFISTEWAITNSSSGSANNVISFSQGPAEDECNDTFCMSHFIILLVFCSAAILSMTSIALDRFMSVAQPLRYNHFVTMKHAQKFVTICWLYSMILCCCVPFFIPEDKISTETHIVLLSCCVYIPCMFLTILSYTYIYKIARSHARAIYSVEISLNHGGIIEVSDSSTSHPRYGLTLAFIVGTFVICWSPIQICAMIDNVSHSNILYHHHWRILAAVPIVFSCAINPYLYAYRSSEIRLAVLRTIDTIMTKITGHPPKIPIFIQDKCDLTSCASNIRLLGPSPTQTTVHCDREGNGAATEANQNHLHLFLCDYQVSTL